MSRELIFKGKFLLYFSKQKISLLGANQSKEQSIKGNTSNHDTPFEKKDRGKAIRQIVASLIANIGPMNTGSF